MLPIEKIKQEVCHYFKKNTNLLESAALLHDIGIKESERKYHSSAGHYQEIEGPAIAKCLLMPYDLCIHNHKPFINRINHTLK